MIKFTSPTLNLIVDADLTNADIYVSMVQGAYEVVKTDVSPTVSEGQTRIPVTLTQEETARFKPNKPIEIQVNWITPGGARMATDIVATYAFRNLLTEVLAYGTES